MEALPGGGSNQPCAAAIPAHAAAAATTTTTTVANPREVMPASQAVTESCAVLCLSWCHGAPPPGANPAMLPRSAQRQRRTVHRPSGLAPMFLGKAAHAGLVPEPVIVRELSILPPPTDDRLILFLLCLGHAGIEILFLHRQHPHLKCVYGVGQPAISGIKNRSTHWIPASLALPRH